MVLLLHGLLEVAQGCASSIRVCARGYWLVWEGSGDAHASHKCASGWLEILWGQTFSMPAFAVASCACFCWQYCAMLLWFLWGLNSWIMERDKRGLQIRPVKHYYCIDSLHYLSMLYSSVFAYSTENDAFLKNGSYWCYVWSVLENKKLKVPLYPPFSCWDSWNWEER